MQTMRTYPKLNVSMPNSDLKRPISFIIIHFCDEYFHNISESDCIKNPFNQVVTIDNRNNVFFETLSQSINAAIDEAKHDLIAIVREDVLLPSGWQEKLEGSLSKLETVDQNWGLIGAVGWKATGQTTGHWSGPYGYKNTLDQKTFEAVEKLGDQLLIFRRSKALKLDADLPTIDNIGRYLSSKLQVLGLKKYAINAPTIHNYASAKGDIIRGPEDFVKTANRKARPYKAEKANNDAYLYEKWPDLAPENYQEKEQIYLDQLDKDYTLNDPILLVSRGGSGSRLLSTLAQDLGVFLGNDVSVSGDSLEMVESIYRGLMSKYKPTSALQKKLIVPRIYCDAKKMVEKSGPHKLWGYKLPESLLLLPELELAFSRAKYIHLIRDPLSTCLRRSHLTARFDNEIGRVTIVEAYKYCHRDVALSLTDPSEIRMAYTTLHQVDVTRKYFQMPHMHNRSLDIRFEDILENPQKALNEVSDWLGVKVRHRNLEALVNADRPINSARELPESLRENIADILAPLRQHLGYI